jgi:hypothetical protein
MLLGIVLPGLLRDKNPPVRKWLTPCNAGRAKSFEIFHGKTGTQPYSLVKPENLRWATIEAEPTREMEYLS